MAKLPELRPDVAVFDLEDGLAADQLSGARLRLRALLAADGPALGAALAVRSHPVADAGFKADVACLGPRLGALLLPKVQGADEVREAAHALARAGLTEAAIVVMIESARGLGALPAILAAHPAVRGVAFGAEDFAADLGLPPAVERSAPGQEGRRAVLDAARSRIVIAAAAAGLAWRIDAATLALHDAALVEHEASIARGMGFSGKFSLHPAQLRAIHLAFQASQAELAWARAVLAAAEAGGTSSAGGASSLDGRMVDAPLLAQALALLAAE